MLPSPALTFTIPSIHDDTTLLDCRVYHPASLAAAAAAAAVGHEHKPHQTPPPWRKHAAIVAHPYATLGGSYDDAVVETISAALLRQGYLVGTFNFRGAGHSTGRTSWTGKAERGDYASFAGFVAYYVHYLAPFQPQGTGTGGGGGDEPCSSPTKHTPSSSLSFSSSSSSPPSSSPLSSLSAAPTTGPTIVSSEDDVAAAPTPSPPPVLLLCGYSYGAMITQHLAPHDALLAPFAAPPIASAAADIRLRAQHLAEKQNTILQASARRAAAAASTSTPWHNKIGGGGGGGSLLRVGGDEDLRRSQEHGSRRSFSLDAEEKIRKGVAELMRGHHHLGLHHHHHHRDQRHSRAEQKEGTAEAQHQQQAETEAEAEAGQREALTAVAGLLVPRMAYLLVSPPLGWATNLMTLNIGAIFGKRPKHTSITTVPPPTPTPPITKKDPGVVNPRGSKDDAVAAARHKLVANPTLAVYGDADVFVAAKKFRAWASRLQAEPGSAFRAHEVSTAGHFYVEQGTLQRLADAVEVFSGELVAVERPSVRAG